MKRSRKYKEAEKKIQKGNLYSIDEAIKLVKETSYTKFVGSVELIINFNVLEKYKNESIRGSLTLPHSTGEMKKVVVIAKGQDETTAKNAGADEVGSDELIKKIEGGYTDFDTLIATPEMMVSLSKLGKILGPKGLMPNPKNETVTTDLERVIKGYKAGKMEYRLDAQGSMKAAIGKINQTDQEIKENFEIFFKTAYSETKKLGVNRLASVLICATMGPSVKLDKNELLKEVE